MKFPTENGGEFAFSANKQALRIAIRSCLAGLAPEEFTREGAAAAKMLARLPGWDRCPSVLLFLAMTTEIDTGPLLETAFSAGKRVFVPRIEGPGELRFYRISAAAGPWREGCAGIREPFPDTGALLRPADFPVLALTPGLAFDREGRRLGRGRGFYDRFFAGLDSGRLAVSGTYSAFGLCMDSQITGEVPAEAHDKRMNGILTGKQLIQTDKR
jgi:5-formyltetrahydrofolate cyclo-ligase